MTRPLALLFSDWASPFGPLRSRWTLPLFVFSLFTPWLGGVARATPPQVLFDVGTLVACPDVTTAEFAARHPGHKIVEAVIRVSVRCQAGSAADIEEVAIEIESPERRLRVFEICPQTQLESEFLGPIEETKTSERNRSLGVTATGKAQIPALPAIAELVPTANAGASSKEIVTEKRQRLTPPDVTLASGSLAEEHGAFFQLRRSSSFSLEGMQRLTLRLLVPSDWRGDWVECRCRATYRERRPFPLETSTETCGENRLYVALYSPLDDEARLAAERLVGAQHEHQQELLSRVSRESRDSREPHAMGGTGNAALDEILAGPKASWQWSQVAIVHPMRFVLRQEATRSKRDTASSAKDAKPRKSSLARRLAEMGRLSASKNGGA